MKELIGRMALAVALDIICYYVTGEKKIPHFAFCVLTGIWAGLG